ncbi:MAG TPA: DUF885 family protein [Capsulimonadaceae bacterium]|nr:DUF885 family protein [Capsulimonadaceae bacterium]
MAIPISDSRIRRPKTPDHDPSLGHKQGDGRHLPESTPLEPQSASAERMPATIMRFRSDRDCLDRCLSVPYSPKRRERMREFFREWQRAQEDVPFSDLVRSDRADWLLFRGLLEAELRRLDREEHRYVEAEPLLPFAASLIALGEARLALEDVNPQAAATQLHEAHIQIKELTKKLEAGEGHAAASVVGYAIHAISRLRTSLESWFNFYNSYDPSFSWWMEKPYQALNKSLEDYGVFLREKVAGAESDTVLGDPIGPEALANELRFSQIPYGPEELIAAAQREMQWCISELRKAAQDLGYGDDWRAALEQVKSEHAAPGGQPALVRDLAAEAVEYVRANNLVTVPALAQECWRMEMISPERQKINPFFWGGESMGVSFPVSEMEHPEKQMSLRGNNRAFARATVHHEMIPGHRLQAFYQERYRPYRRVFYTPFWTEGWTLHWEMLLWERGFPRTPQEKIGMLFWRQHRCARVVFSLKFHLGQMTALECIEMLVNETGHELENARAEVRRSFESRFDPLYQAAYLIGGMQVHALYNELVGLGHMSDQEFHDAFLQENCMPIATLRALLTDGPLDRDYQPEWRFLDQPAERSASDD